MLLEGMIILEFRNKSWLLYTYFVAQCIRMKVNIKKGQLTILIIPFYFFLPFTILFIFLFPGLEGFNGFLELIQKFLL